MSDAELQKQQAKAREAAESAVEGEIYEKGALLLEELGCVYHQAPHNPDLDPTGGCECSIEWDRVPWMRHGVYRAIYLALDIEALVAQLLRIPH